MDCVGSIRNDEVALVLVMQGKPVYITPLQLVALLSSGALGDKGLPPIPCDTLSVGVKIRGDVFALRHEGNEIRFLMASNQSPITAAGNNEGERK